MQAAFGLSRPVGVENASEVTDDIRPHGHLGHVGHGVADRMELAPPPRHSGHDGLTGGPEPGMIVADDERHAVDASFLRAFEELQPVRLGLRELHSAAEHAPLAIGVDPDRSEQCARPDGAIVADLLVVGVEREVGDPADQPILPAIKLLIDLGSGSLHLGRGNCESAEFLDNGLGSSRTRWFPWSALFLNPRIAWYRKSNSANPVTSPNLSTALPCGDMPMSAGNWSATLRWQIDQSSTFSLTIGSLRAALGRNRQRKLYKRKCNLGPSVRYFSSGRRQRRYSCL